MVLLLYFKSKNSSLIMVDTLELVRKVPLTSLTKGKI